jgi:hypothetical protein
VENVEIEDDWPQESKVEIYASFAELMLALSQVAFPDIELKCWLAGKIVKSLQ